MRMADALQVAIVTLAAVVALCVLVRSFWPARRSSAPGAPPCASCQLHQAARGLDVPRARSRLAAFRLTRH
jgi:hypothetical protein